MKVRSALFRAGWALLALFTWMFVSRAAVAADLASPVLVALPAGVTAQTVETGSGSSLFVGSDGRLYSWGLNSDGRLGDGTTDNRSTPQAAPLPGGVAATVGLSATSHGLMVGSDGGVYSWGDNFNGQLGDGGTTDQWTPTAITLADGVSGTGVSAGDLFSLAIGSDGRVYSWGNNSSGRLGDGSDVFMRSTPEAIVLATGVTATAVSAGSVHSLAIGSDGKLYAWGKNDVGQLGDGTDINRGTPVVVTLADGVSPTAVAAGSYHSMAIGSDGRLYAWGWDAHGTLGQGTVGSNRNTPTVVVLPGGASPTAIAAGYAHSLAVGDDGRLYGWGWNNHGQVGDGTTTDRPSPVEVRVPVGVVHVSAGFNHSLAASASGVLYGWGDDTNGQAGGGSSTVALVPPTAVAVAEPASGYAPLTVALSGAGSSDADGTIVGYAWSISDGRSASGESASVTFDDVGSYLVTLTVTDNHGARDTATQTITVNPPPNQAPSALFTATPESGAAPLEVSFDASGSGDADGDIVEYAWSVSDGRAASGVSASLLFEEAGSYQVTLTVTDDDGATDQRSRTIVVGEALNQPPSASFTATPESGAAPLTVSLDATASEDDDGTIVAYDWSSSDGRTASGSVVEMTFEESGTYTVTLTVTDDDGDHASASRSVTVGAPNQPPVAVVEVSPASGPVPLVVVADGSGSSDPDGRIEQYAWSSSDGQSARGEEVSFEFAAAGTYVLTLEVTDDQGESATESVVVRAFAPLTVNPAQLVVSAEEVVTLSAAGGVGPYRWSATAGLLLSTEGRQVRFVAPSTNCEGAEPCHTVTVTDSLGNQAEAGVLVSADLRLTPQLITVALIDEEMEEVRLEASGGVAPYAWSADGGAIDGDGAVVEYTPPAEEGVWMVTVADAQGSQISARVTVISLPVVTPASVTLRAGETVNLTLTGGSDPVSWSADAGDLSQTSGRSVTYIAPDELGRYRVTAVDGGGRVAKVRVLVVGEMLLSPAQATVAVGELVQFAVARGVPPYTWPDGRQGRSWNTRFDTAGRHQVVVTDAAGGSALAVVQVVADGLEVTPAHGAVPPGDVVNLSVSGGTPPYSWSVDAGSLSAVDGSAVDWVAPTKRGEYAVTVTDDSGLSGVARIRVTSAMVENPACAPRCGKVESDISIDGVEHPDGESHADEGAELSIGFGAEAPDDDQSHHLYVACIWTGSDGVARTLFLTGDAGSPFALWNGGAFPSYGELAAGESVDVEFYNGPSTGLRGTFDFYVGFAPAGDLGRLTFNQQPYRVELE